MILPGVASYLACVLAGSPIVWYLIGLGVYQGYTMVVCPTRGTTLKEITDE